MLIGMRRIASSLMLVFAVGFGFGMKAQTAPPAAVTDPAPAGYSSVEVLWPKGAPGAVGTRADDIPKLYCYPVQGSGLHPAVVVLPGGGYLHLVNEKEGAAEARWLNARGVSAYILQYRLSPRYQYPAPMLDGERAVRFVRAHAKEWHLKSDAVGVWGFSAGGHLAGYLATAEPHGDPTPFKGFEVPARAGESSHSKDEIDKLSARPDFAILSYARLTIDRAIPGTFGMESITGKDAPQAMNEALSPVLHVTKSSAPSFIYATERDEKVNSLNATAFFDALQRAGVDAELHVFERGPHGTGMGQNLAKTPELAVWPLLLQGWMMAHGWIEKTP